MDWIISPQEVFEPLFVAMKLSEKQSDTYVYSQTAQGRINYSNYSNVNAGQETNGFAKDCRGCRRSEMPLYCSIITQYTVPSALPWQGCHTIAQPEMRLSPVCKTGVGYFF
jgi:hypothetical protein